MNLTLAPKIASPVARATQQFYQMCSGGSGVFIWGGGWPHFHRAELPGI